MKASEVEELTEAFKAVKTQMATELEANVEIKGKLESDLTSTKHSLLDVKHQLNMAEKVCIPYLFNYQPTSNVATCKITSLLLKLKNYYFQELEKKFSQTGAYKNLKKMLAQKNQQIKELRAQLKGQQEDNENDIGDAEEEE